MPLGQCCPVMFGLSELGQALRVTAQMYRRLAERFLPAPCHGP